MYKFISKNFLFLMDAEKAHHFTMTLFRIILSIPILGKIFKSFFTISDPKLETHLWGLTFKNPVGLAAGFDKDGKYFEPMQNLGFGFIEIGTVTPVGQAGNDKPRLFRLPADDALINRMGFNNDGVEALVTRLKKSKKSDVIIGGNIGKNKVTPNDEAVHDYLKCFESLYDFVDYFVVNVSSPNTPGLRELQDKEPLTRLLNTLVEANKKKPALKPILLKIAPDLTDEQLDDIVEIVLTTDIQGVIATNTTIDRSNIMTSTDHIGAGGLSGKPLAIRSTEVIRYLHHKSKGKVKIIGVGGISTPKDAIEKLEAGASLVQVYSGLVYYGPTLVRDINRLILSRK